MPGDRYVVKDGKRLRCGYTTGTCAAAAAKAAALLLISGHAPRAVSLTLPAGTSLTLPVGRAARGDGWARCAVQKDAGDDPDVTDGVWVYATVSHAPAGLTIDGGEGVGRVTKAGLDQPVGAAAINSVPRRMIAGAVKEAAAAHGFAGGLSVIVSIPAGRALAARTFNPRMGIEGGLSVIGTSGIVEPMSDAALTQTIRAELRMRRAAGRTCAVLTPGRYGEAFLTGPLGLTGDACIQCGNFIGDAVQMAAAQGFGGLLLVGHLGKLVKLAGGMLNTHSRYGDCRMALLCAHAAACGVLPPNAARALLNAAAVEEALRLLDRAGIRTQTLRGVLEAAHAHIRRVAGEMETGIILFTNGHGLVGQTENATALLAAVQKEETP